MAEHVFLDSNVLIYAVSKHPADSEKFAVANRILQEEQVSISVQVMQEFFVNATTKGGMPAAEAREWLEALDEYPCVQTTRDLAFAAVDHAARFRIHYWDAAIVAAAEQSGASILYTEDLNHGQHYGRVQVLNPFLNQPH